MGYEFRIMSGFFVGGEGNSESPFVHILEFQVNVFLLLLISSLDPLSF